MRHFYWCSAALLTLAVIGCSGSGSQSPVAPVSPESPGSTGADEMPMPQAAPTSVPGTLGSAVQHGDIHTSALAIYTVDIDPASLTATSRLKETRSGQANDDLYLLSIDSFLTAGSFKVTGVTADANDLSLDYLVTHPFPAPNNITGTPNGSTNRADLGIAGMVLFLADVPSATGNTYFTDRIANTALVTNADAYYSPGSLIGPAGTANTFPYRQLVDEVADSRDGVSNGGTVTGNFGTDGWTRSEFGAGNNGWTGYGMLHQGQASRNSVAFDKDALAGGFSLDVAIIAKYPDPRGGATAAQKKANRLPPATPDASLFAYRMPHGALDGASIVVEAEPAGFIANTISAAQVSVHVVDWDARGTETAAADLSEDASFTNVAVGESGAPTVEISIPGVLGDATATEAVATVVDDDSAYGGDAGQDFGAAGDPLFYSELVSKTAGTGQTAGDFTGLVRVTDPEVGLTIGLDPTTLLPLAVQPTPVTYQSFTVTQLPDNAAPTAVVTLTSGNPLLSGTAASVAITSIADGDTDNLDVLVDWGDGGGFVTVASGLTGPAYPDQTPSSPQMNNADLVVDTINIVVRLDDGTAQVDYPLSYDLGANRAPVVTGTPALATASVTTPATFNMNTGTSTVTDPEGDAVSYTITNTANSDVVSFASFPNQANSTPIVPTGVVTFTIRANDALHATTSGTAYPTVAGTVLPAGPVLGWARKPPGSTSLEYSYGVGTSGTDVLLLGTYYGTQDFGGGNRTSNGAADIFAVKYDADGTYLWDYTAGGTASETQQDVVADASGNVWISCYVSGSVNFGGGVRTTASTDSFLVKLNSAGVYQTDVQIGGASFDYCYSLDTDAAGNVATGGYFASDPLTIGADSANSNGNAAWLAKFNSAGTPQWARFFDGSATTSDYNYATCFDPAGAVYCAVQNWNTTGVGADYGGGPRLAVSSPDEFTVKYTAAGAYAWDSRLSSTLSSSQYLYGIAANASRVAVAGYYTGSPDFGGGARAAVGGGDVCVVAYNSTTGLYDWDWVAGSTSSSDIGRGIDFDASGNVFVSGYAYNNTNFGGGARTAVGGLDPFVVKLNPTGSWQWDHNFGSTSSEYSYDCAVDSAGDVVASGYFYNTVDFEPGAGVTNLTSTGSADPYVIKIDGPTGGW